jgi:hypothetical protein
MGLQGLKKGASVVPGANKSLEVTAELSSSIKGKLGALFQIKSAHNSKHKVRHPFPWAFQACAAHPIVPSPTC